MADKVLSQDEVDALLKGVTDGEVETKIEPPPKGGIRTYDLSSQERIIRGRMVTLEIINERFARHFQIGLSTMLRRPVEVSARPIEVIKFRDFVQKIPVPSSITLLKFDPLKGYPLLVIDSMVIYILLDYFLGGFLQTHVKPEGKDFTPIEQGFIKKIVEIFIKDLESAWQSVEPIRVSVIRSEVNPQFAMVVQPEEVVISILFKIEVEGTNKEFLMCLPYPTIEPIRDKLYGGFQADQVEVENQWANRMRKELMDCKVSVMVELGKTTLSVQDINQLAIGDVLLLETHVDDPLFLKVEGQDKYQGRAGIHRGKSSLQISRLLEPEV